MKWNSSAFEKVETTYLHIDLQLELCIENIIFIDMKQICSLKIGKTQHCSSLFVCPKLVWESRVKFKEIIMFYIWQESL